MKKVVVTGGLGFIGSNLVDILLDKGIEVIIVDNKISNSINESMFNNKCDILLLNVEDAVSRFPKDIDHVFHLASFVGPSGVLKYAGEMAKVIINDTIKVRDFCIESGAKFIDISTSEVYGHTGLLKEDSQKIYPGIYQVRTEYGAGKMAAEISVVNKAKVNKRLKYHIIRPFNVSGPRQRPNGGFVLPRFVIAALTGQPITIFGDGNQERAFTDVRDICEAILQIIDSKYINEIWNIGNIKNRMTINNLSHLVVSRINKKHPEIECEIIHVDPKEIHGSLFAEAIDKVPYTNKINNMIGWEASYSIKRTIDDLITFYEEEIKNGYTFKVI